MIEAAHCFICPVKNSASEVRCLANNTSDILKHQVGFNDV